MADIQPTDQFLVNRSTPPHRSRSDLMAEILDDDPMLVNRGNQTYRVTGLEVEDSLNLLAQSAFALHHRQQHSRRYIDG